jgi:hypothetical protein
MHFSTWRIDLTIRPSSSSRATASMLTQQRLRLSQNAWAALQTPSIG